MSAYAALPSRVDNEGRAETNLTEHRRTIGDVWNEHGERHNQTTLRHRVYHNYRKEVVKRGQASADPVRCRWLAWTSYGRNFALHTTICLSDLDAVTGPNAVSLCPPLCICHVVSFRPPILLMPNAA